MGSLRGLSDRGTGAGRNRMPIAEQSALRLRENILRRSGAPGVRSAGKGRPVKTAVLVIDRKDGAILEASASALSLLGLTRIEPTSLSIFDLFKDGQIFQDLLTSKGPQRLSVGSN